MQARIIRIEKDDRLQQNLFRSAEDWRERHLIKNNCPPVDASESLCLISTGSFSRLEMMPFVQPLTRRGLIVDYEKSLEEYRMAEAKVQLLKNQLIKQIGHFGGLERPVDIKHYFIEVVIK